MLRTGLLASLTLLVAACATSPKPTVTSTAPADADRKAILAMAGSYDVKFDFEETLALQPDYKLHKPHHSEAHELVQVLEDSPRRIVLQHILVDDRGHVTKHWRQDWEYEQTRFWSYAGGYAWQRRDISPSEAQGRWVQTVWQVDDSPRYAGVGRWEHANGVSRWTSDASWRPLPRREYTERNDYDVLVTINRHTITPTGWSHEQDSYKLDRGTQKILAAERGNNTYTHNTTFDFKAARDYWQKTSPYWEAVRHVWADAFTRFDKLALIEPDREDDFGDGSHFMAVIKQANDLAINAKPLAEREAAVRATLKTFLTEGGASKAPTTIPFKTASAAQ